MTDLSYTAVLRLLVAHSIIVERFSGELASWHGLSLNEVLLLIHLRSAPQHRLSRVDLARRLHVNASTVTRMAAPMEKSGLLSRQPDPRDARLAYVVLTDAGARLAAEARDTLEQRSKDLFNETWSAADIASLAQGLAHLTGADAGNLA